MQNREIRVRTKAILIICDLCDRKGYKKLECRYFKKEVERREEALRDLYVALP